MYEFCPLFVTAKPGKQGQHDQEKQEKKHHPEMIRPPSQRGPSKIKIFSNEPGRTYIDEDADDERSPHEEQHLPAGTARTYSPGWGGGVLLSRWLCHARLLQTTMAPSEEIHKNIKLSSL